MDKLPDFYQLLDVKKPEPRYGRCRSRSSKRLRKALNQIIGQHDWASAGVPRRQIIDEARRLRRHLRHHPPTFATLTGWYIFQRMREESYTRRVFKIGR